MALKGAVQELPANSGMELANWNWKVVCQYVSERFGISLSRSTCLNYLRRLGFLMNDNKSCRRIASIKTLPTLSGCLN